MVASVWSVFGIIALSILLVVVLLALIAVFIDLTRDPSLGTGAKVVWMIALILLPVVGLLIYVATRGRGMRGRSGVESDAPGQAGQAGEPAT